MKKTILILCLLFTLPGFSQWEADCFEPGDRREVELVPFVGARRVVGFNAQVNGHLDGDN